MTILPHHTVAFHVHLPAFDVSPTLSFPSDLGEPAVPAAFDVEVAALLVEASASGLTFFKRLEKDEIFFSSVFCFFAMGAESACDCSRVRFGAGAEVGF